MGKNNLKFPNPFPREVPRAKEMGNGKQEGRFKIEVGGTEQGHKSGEGLMKGKSTLGKVG